MSAAPRYPSDIGYHGLRMTAEQFFSLGETQERYELIDGVVVMSPSPTPNHGDALSELMRQLTAYAHEGRQARVFPDTDVLLTTGKVYRPDISVYLSHRLPKKPMRLTLPPDLAVEVLSPGTKPLDLYTKRDDYDAFGVGEYWIVDPAVGSLQVWRRKDAGMHEVEISGDSFVSAILPGMTLDLKALREACV